MISICSRCKETTTPHANCVDLSVDAGLQRYYHKLCGGRIHFYENIDQLCDYRWGEPDMTREQGVSTMTQLVIGLIMIALVIWVRQKL